MIYFIRAEESGRIKIGRAKDPSKRLTLFRTGCPEVVSLLAVMDGDEEEEKQLHERFKQFRLRPRSEWFSPGEELLRFIREYGKPYRRPAPTKKQALLVLPTSDFNRLRRVAEKRGMPLPKFIKAAILKETERVEQGIDLQCRPRAS